MDVREINIDDIEGMNITDNTKTRYKDYFWQTIEHNNKFKKYTLPKKIQTLVTALSENQITLITIFKKFPQLFMDVCDKIPKKDAEFLISISIPLHMPFPIASPPKKSRTITRPSLMKHMYRQFTSRGRTANANSISPVTTVTNEEYRSWYTKTSIHCIKEDYRLLRFIDKSVLRDKHFAEEAVRTKFDTIEDIIKKGASLTNREIVEKIYQKYEADINDVNEVKVFLKNYLLLKLRDKTSLIMASKEPLVRRITKFKDQSTTKVISYLGGNKRSKRTIKIYP